MHDAPTLRDFFTSFKKIIKDRSIPSCAMQRFGSLEFIIWFSLSTVFVNLSSSTLKFDFNTKQFSWHDRVFMRLRVPSCIEGDIDASSIKITFRIFPKLKRSGSGKLSKSDRWLQGPPSDFKEKDVNYLSDTFYRRLFHLLKSWRCKFLTLTSLSL